MGHPRSTPGPTAVNKTTLDYASSAGTWRRRGRTGLIWAIVLGLGLLLYWDGPAAWYEVRFLAYQRQWASCTLDPNKAVFDSTSYASPYFDGFDHEKVSPFSGQVVPPRRSFPAWQERDRCGTVFLHELTSHSGNRRIVCIDVTGFDIVYPHYRSRVVHFDESVYVPGWRPHGCVDGGRHWYVDCPASARLQFFGGHTDSQDKSHFTVRYSYNGVAGTLNGYLQDDNDIRLVPDRGTGGGPDPTAGWIPSAPQRSSEPQAFGPK